MSKNKSAWAIAGAVFAYFLFTKKSTAVASSKVSYGGYSGGSGYSGGGSSAPIPAAVSRGLTSAAAGSLTALAAAPVAVAADAARLGATFVPSPTLPDSVVPFEAPALRVTSSAPVSSAGYVSVDVGADIAKPLVPSPVYVSTSPVSASAALSSVIPSSGARGGFSKM